MNDVSDEEQPLAYVPGLDREVKFRAPFSFGPRSSTNKKGTNVQVKRNSDCRKEATLKKGYKKHSALQSDCSGAYVREKGVFPSAAVAEEHTPSPGSSAAPPVSQVHSKDKSQISLKDLCPEDKRRIANLIEELARVSEEKEESVQRLKDEQGLFECKIQQMAEQNVIIAQERESLQQQYKECQELLGLYQQYLSQQQAKLNESIAQLTQPAAHRKVLSDEEAPSRTCTSQANGSLFDGSYLGLAPTQALQPNVLRASSGRRGAVQTTSNHASLSCDSVSSPADDPISQYRTQTRECGLPQSHHRRESGHCSGPKSGYETQQRTNRNTNNQHNCDGTPKASTSKEGIASPVLGPKDWEERRHQLLLQKVQLEIEREKLQARLAEQEERLNRQNQQSLLENNRFQPAELKTSSKIRTGDPPPEGPSHQDLPSSACRGHKDAEVNEKVLHEKSVPVHSGHQTSEALERSRRDMATSPVPSSYFNNPAVMPTTLEPSLDLSLAELLEIFSPICPNEKQRMSTCRSRRAPSQPPRSAPKPVLRGLTPAAACPQTRQQELEESKILEDIFFIC